MTWNIQILEDVFKIDTPELDDRYFTIVKESGISIGMFKVYKVIEVLDIKDYSYVKCNIILTKCNIGNNITFILHSAYLL